eukprot:CAMPEP_0168385516 /NCGR_PEP_ID=MMETSP0228-20121227/14960_1 /TAXON_ID=133427 /ORGANISM="Protoceratium reticulatum, Strain CCCM 535 (=CCMP 1889)" /LENGTH=68 /DNA_ID=CAMNT_0008398703 /DNA_START=10 /DNA_END=212 /DNA_ORIENTATION=+
MGLGKATLLQNKCRDSQQEMVGVLSQGCGPPQHTHKGRSLTSLVAQVLNHRREVGLQRGTAHQEAVNV